MSATYKPLVIITGASSGIGMSIAKSMSREGHALLLLARRSEPMLQLQLQGAMCRTVDVTDRAAFLSAVREAESKFGPADALVNNAGVMLLGDMATQDPDEWERMLDINVKGLLNGIHTVIDGMVQRRRGTIINISSVAGRKTFPSHVAYVGTKFAVHGISENLREEMSPHGVRVITIAPGAVETALLSHTTNEDIKAGYASWKQEMGGVVLSAQDVANAVCYAYSQPQHICVREIVLAATRQQA